MTNGPLTALAGGGVYAYGSGNAFPSDTYNSANYWVDVVFSQSAGSTPPAVTTVTPGNGATGVAVSVAPTATFSEAVQPEYGVVHGEGLGRERRGRDGELQRCRHGGDVHADEPADGRAPRIRPRCPGRKNSSGVRDERPVLLELHHRRGGSVPVQHLAERDADGRRWTRTTPARSTWACSSSASGSGYITGVRFYKYSDNTGTHTGSLWSADGTLLATGTFSGESGSGWQELDFSSPVPVTAGTTYVASYHTDAGHYAITPSGLASAVTNGPLTALAGGGVYAYGSGNAFPSDTYNAANYWVDVVFSQSAGSTPPAVTTVTPGDGATGVAVSVAPTATFSEAVVPDSVSFTVKDSGGNTVAGSVSFNGADTVATFTPSNPLAGGTTYTATVSGAQNSLGHVDERPVLVELHHRRGGSVPVQHLAERGAVGVGGRGRYQRGQPGRAVPGASGTGTITGVRFYKESDNTGTHTGSLWTADGTLLATGTFSGESGSGWQELDFSSPVSVTAGTTYVASYHTDAGHYAITPSGLASAVTNGPLTALAGGGVYAYGSGNAFPSDTFNASNYWVDVVYSPSAGSTAPAVTRVTPDAGSTGDPVSVAPTATFSQAVVPDYGVVHGEGLRREHGGRLGELQRCRYGGDVHPVGPAGGQHHVHRDGVGGAECLGHVDDRPVLVELHHRRGGSVPVQHLAERGAVGCGGRGRYQRGEPGRAVPGDQ